MIIINAPKKRSFAVLAKYFTNKGYEKRIKRINGRIDRSSRRGIVQGRNRFYSNIKDGAISARQ
jgi:hypothetical protein